MTRVFLDSIILGLQRFGGITTYWLELCRHLVRMPDIDLYLKVPHTRSRLHELDLGTLSTAARTSILPPALARYLPSFAPRTHIHHTSYYRNPWSEDAISVVTVYDFVYERFRKGLARSVHMRQKARAIERADGVLCISENTRRDLLDRFPAIDVARVKVSPLGVDLEKFCPVTSIQRTRSLFDVVLFVGQRTGYKAFDIAIDAVASSPSLRLGIVGSRPQPDELEQLGRRLPKRWLYVGEVTDSALRLAYGSCFALIYPSLYEGFGLPVLEAMACGCPVVTNRLSSLPEVGGNAALYTAGQVGEAYAEQLSRLEESSFRTSVVQAGLSWCQLFPWSRTATMTVALYRSLS